MRMYQQKTLISSSVSSSTFYTAVTLTELILFLALSDEVVDVVQTFLMQILQFRKELIRFLSRFLSRNSFIMQFMRCLQALP